MNVILKGVELGKTGELIPAIGQGTAGFGRYSPYRYYRYYAGMPKILHGFWLDRSPAIEPLITAIDLGARLIDTAESYGRGYSEEIVSRVVKLRRNEIFVATKVSRENLSPSNLRRSAENSRRRLGVKSIDLFQIHWPNPEISIQSTVRAMEKLIDEGIVRYIGVCNFKAELLAEAVNSTSRHQIVSNQIAFSLLERSIEKNLEEYCRKEHVTIIAHSPLHRGLLTDENVSRITNDRLKAALVDMRSRYDRSISQIALNWIASHPGTTCIPRSVNLRHAIDNCQATDFSLREPDKMALEEAC